MTEISGVILEPEPQGERYDFSLYYYGYLMKAEHHRTGLHYIDKEIHDWLIESVTSFKFWTKAWNHYVRDWGEVTEVEYYLSLSNEADAVLYMLRFGDRDSPTPTKIL